MCGAATVAMLAAAVIASPIPAQAQTARDIDIPAGTLGNAIAQLGRKTGVMIIFDPALVRDRRTGGLNGTYTPAQALDRLLAGSGIEARTDGKGGYRLVRQSFTQPAAQDDRRAEGRRARQTPAGERRAQERPARETIVVTAPSTDAVGYDNVYKLDISNLYLDRQYLERYKGVSPGDIFAGMNGVYNIDNRNGAALAPILRGVSGNGRIPLTIDGTVQSLDVWQGVHGINNRSYADPNLFRSVEVEKGPSMTRGVKSGVGGSVAIRTIDASDIIQPGKNWGIELKLGTANNSIDSGFDALSIEGVDYRTLPGVAGGSTLFGTPTVGFYQNLGRDREHGGGAFNGDARNIFVAGGFRRDAFDMLLAFSDQRRGNYFAGSSGIDGYVGNTEPHEQALFTTRNLYPNIGRVFPARYEVPYTSSRSQSLLAKVNWEIAPDHRLSLGYTRNKLRFGELPVFVVDQFVGNATTTDDLIDGVNQRLEYPSPDTRVRQNVYRLGYTFKPEGSKLIDFDVNLWRTENRSHRYQTGDITYGVDERDLDWDRYVNCNHDPMLLAFWDDPFWRIMYEMTCPGITPGGPAPTERAPNTDGRYDLKVGNLLISRSTRTGVDVSNRFRLADGLDLTISGDFQYEKVRDVQPVTDVAVLIAGAYALAYGPASGRRREYGLGANLEWQATSRLQLSAGARYGDYWGFDDETAAQRAARNPIWELNHEAVASNVQVRRLMTPEEMAMWSSPDRWDEWQAYMAANGIVDEFAGGAHHQLDYPLNLRYVTVNNPVPLRDAKADRHRNPFYNGSIDINETVTDPIGIDGNVVPGTYRRYEAMSANGVGDVIRDFHIDHWKQPQRQSLKGWNAQFVASYQLTDHVRAYARFASIARFPSLLETANRTGFGGVAYAEMTIRPERSNAWEIGYHHDLRGALPGLRRADAKLTWYHNTIHNYYDRNTELITIQFDRKINSGLEFQGRFDAGIVYGSLGATWRIKQKMCDADYAVMLDPHYFRIPECMDGGMPGTISYQTLQPHYSVNLDLGMRLFDERLNLGARLRHHGKSRNKSLDRFFGQHACERDPRASIWWFCPNGEDYPASGKFSGVNRPYYWDPVSLVDMYAEFRVTDKGTILLSIDNLTNRYYMDPLTRLTAPAPGRTARIDIVFRM